MYVCILHQGGEILVHRHMPAGPDPFLKAIAPYRADLVVGVACLFTWYWLADLCAREGLPVVLGHALYMQARYALAEPIGTDGRQVLRAIYDPATPGWLRELPAIQTLRQVWLQQFYASPPDQPVRWRSAEDLPPAPVLISSPYAPEARYGQKRETEWTGDKVHITETCDDETPNLITDVTTTPATTSDFAMLPTMQARLAARQLTPREQIVDVGSVTADHLWTSRTDC
jgi:hypothetical protein